MELSRLQKGGRAVLIWAKGVRVCGAGLGRGEAGVDGVGVGGAECFCTCVGVASWEKE